MASCYERETLLVAEYPREKRQREEPDDGSESEPREDSKDLYGDVEEIEDSVPGFLEPGNLESGLRLPPNPSQSFKQGATSFQPCSLACEEED